MNRVQQTATLARRHPTAAWLAAFLFYLVTPFPPVPWETVLGAQTIVNSTTTTAAVNGTQQLIPLTAVTSISAGIRNLGGDLMFFADGSGEVDQVNVIDATGKTLNVKRGVQGTTVAPHVSGVVVYTGPAQRFAKADGFGSCTATNELYLPKINTRTNRVFDCLGGAWVRVDAPGATVVGSTVASVASAVALTGTYFKISGTNGITGFTLPNGWAPGMCFAIEPTAAFTTTTAGNIGLASTGVIGKVLFECWSGTKWQPSY